MSWIGLLVAAWLALFFLGAVVARWAVSDVAPLTTGAWLIVLLSAGLLASAAPMGLAAGRWRREAQRDAGTSATTARSEFRLGNGYALLAAAFVVAAVLLVLVYRLVYTV